MKPLLLLIDGSNFFFRKKIKDLQHNGHPTGAISGFINYLDDVYNKLKPDLIAVVFDMKEATFRHQIFPEYKANRAPLEDFLRMQIQPLQELLTALGYPVLKISGFEADDIIGSLAAQYTDFKVIICSGDKDMLQLLTRPDVEILDDDKTLTETDIPTRFKIDVDLRAHQIPDLLALMGDKTDNFKGITGVGEKTAAKIIRAWGNVQNIMKNAAKIDEKVKISSTVKKNIQDEAHKLPLFLKLATIKTDIDLSKFSLKKGEVNREKALQLCEQFGLQKVKKRHGLTGSNIERNYKIIKTLAEFRKLIETLKTRPYFAFDTETTSLDMTVARIVGVSIADEVGSAFYLPFAHGNSEDLFGNENSENLAPEAFQLLKKILEDESIKKIVHNGKYDWHVLQNAGIQLRGVIADTLLMSYLFSSSSKHNLEMLSELYLNEKCKTYEEITQKNKIPFAEVNLQEAADYAAEDADMTLRLYEFFSAKLTAPLHFLHETVELPLSFVLGEMERVGVRLDVKALQMQTKHLTAAIENLKNQIITLAGQHFNLNSPKQVGEVLFEKLGLPVRIKTSQGKPSTSEEALQNLVEHHEIVAHLLNFRELSKLKSTYTEALPKQINPLTSRLHTNFQQAVTTTGRLSSSSPNLQNIPINTALGREIRDAFIAADGFQILAADYSQIELRVMAHFAEDPNMIAAFRDNFDIHTATAAEIFGIKFTEVTKEQRRSAKAINFGLIYGMSDFGLAKRLNIPLEDARGYIDKYFQRYQKVRDFMEAIKAAAVRNGYVETILGRRIYLPEINHENYNLRQKAERLAINAPIQGSAADVIKLAMLKIHERFFDSSEIKMLLQVHDELVFEIKNQTVIEEVKYLMENAYALKVPLLVETGVGYSWLKAH